MVFWCGWRKKKLNAFPSNFHSTFCVTASEWTRTNMEINGFIQFLFFHNSPQSSAYSSHRGESETPRKRKRKTENTNAVNSDTVVHIYNYIEVDSNELNELSLISQFDSIFI